MEEATAGVHGVMMSGDNRRASSAAVTVVSERIRPPAIRRRHFRGMKKKWDKGVD